MVARELGRRDTSVGILGSGIQARLQAHMHAEALDLREIWLWGRNPLRAESCRRDIQSLLPHAAVRIASNPAEVAHNAKLIITATASRDPLLYAGDIRPGTHISAVGSDSPGKQELDPAILSNAALLLVDSRAQCEKLGELQHAPTEWRRAIEIGTFCEAHIQPEREGITVADLTGLGVEDLYIAEYCYERAARRQGAPI
jgi:ornithine cyclodeaminase